MKAFYSLICFLFLLFVSSACSNTSSNTNNSQEDSLNTAKESPDIVVPIKIEDRSDDEYYSDPHFMYFFITNESDDSIFIEPKSEYYDIFSSDKRMQVEWQEQEFLSDILEYPTLNFYIENNNDSPLTISSLDVCVSKSELDTFPYLQLYVNAEELFTMNIMNDSWYDWGDMKISYSILKRGESFNGHYEHTRTISFFTNDTTLNFQNDIKDINNEIYYYLDESNLLDKDITVEDADILSYPYEYGCRNEPGFAGNYYIFARMFGNISFTNSSFTKDFESRIFITTYWYGGQAIGVSDEFDVELKTEGSNYKLSFPYSTTIKPHDSERIQLTLKCPKSSIHNFLVRFNNDNGLDIRSKNVKLHYLNSRNSTKQPQNIETFGE